MELIGRIVTLILLCILMLLGANTEDFDETAIVGGGESSPELLKLPQVIKTPDFVWYVVEDARTGNITTQTTANIQRPQFQMGRAKYTPPSSDRQISTIMRYGRPQERGRLISLLLKHGYKGSLDRLSSLSDMSVYRGLPALRSHGANTGRASHQGDEVAYQLCLHIGKEINSLKGGRMMDIGCGDGTITRVLAKHLNITDISCIEVDEFVPDGIKYYTPGQYDGPLVDLVTCFFSLHHIPDVENTVKQIYDMLKPGGYVMIKEHDCWNPVDAMVVDIEHSVFIARETNFQPLVNDHTVWFKNYVAWDLMFSKFTLVWSDYYEASGRADISPSRGYFAIYRKEV